MIVNASDIDGLRRQAQQLAKTHPALYPTVDVAKDVIARREGYSTWRVMLQQATSPLSQVTPTERSTT